MANFEDIALVLDMCHKYIATALEARIVAHLSCFFPCSLEQFLSSERDDRKKVAPFDYTSLECNARIANVARKTGALRLLPATLFRLCRHKPDEVLRASLSPENLRAVLVGRARLSAYAREGTYKYLFDDSPYRSYCCQGARSSLAIRLTDADGWLDPLQPRTFGGEIPPLCQRCTQRTMQSYDEGRAHTWAKLPGFFALPDWSTFIPRDGLSMELELYGEGDVLSFQRFLLISMDSSLQCQETFEPKHILVWVAHSVHFRLRNILVSRRPALRRRTFLHSYVECKPNFREGPPECFKCVPRVRVSLFVVSIFFCCRAVLS